MSSHLQHSSSSSPLSTQPSSTTTTTSSIAALRRKNMSITQTYYLAHTARGKLSKEAARADHHLRLLVGHANLLDSLMLQLAEAERDQEQWFNQTVRGAAEASEEESRSSRRIQWVDTIIEEPEEDWEAEDAESDDSDSDSDYEPEDAADIYVAPRATASQSSITITPLEVDDDEDYDSDEYNEELALVRSPSRMVPELLDDSDDSSSDDDSMPPSPPQPTIEFSVQQSKQITHAFPAQAGRPLSETDQSSFFEDGYFLPQRTSQSTTPMMVTAY